MKSPSLLIALAACSSSPPPPSFAVSPDSTRVLTCSTAQFTATDDATWSADPGAIDDTGLYTSPIATPSPATATITATALAPRRPSATAAVALATAFPGAALAVPGSPGSSGPLGTVGVFQHSFAARGDRAYAVWPVNPPGASSVTLQIARSTDAGASWQAATPAFDAALKSGTDTSQSWVECASLAIDAANPDVIYATARISGGNSLGASVGHPDDPTLVFAVSSDGGATFTQRVLRAGSTVGFCADVVSPAADSVVIDDPDGECGKDIWVWSDRHRGQAFAGGANSASGFVAAGATSALDSVDGKACDAPDKITVESNGTTAAGGEATEAPRLFTDGAGRVCISYVGDTVPQAGPPTHSYVQCSDDFGATFSATTSLDATAIAGTAHSQPNGTIGGNGAAVAWVRSLDTNNQAAFLFVATSANRGRNFWPAVQVPTYVLPGQSAGAPAVNPTVMFDAAGILWLAYRVDDGGVADRIVVDKSCDGGTTWSGPVLVNGTEEQVTAGTFADMKWPVLVPGSGEAPHLAASADAQIAVFALTP